MTLIIYLFGMVGKLVMQDILDVMIVLLINIVIKK